jgi:hypothetical protein
MITFLNVQVCSLMRPAEQIPSLAHGLCQREPLEVYPKYNHNSGFRKLDVSFHCQFVTQTLTVHNRLYLELFLPVKTSLG